MTEPEARVRVVRHEYLKQRWPAESERAEKLRVFRQKIGMLAPGVTEEAVIVTLAQPRLRWVGEKKIEWQDRYSKDHLHIDVQKFRDLIDGKKSAGYEITIKDAVEAYLLVFGFGRKSMIAGFLWALKDEYPEFAVKHEEVTHVVKEAQLFGPPREVLKTERIARPIASVEELVDTVGQALSRLRAEGVIRG